MKKLILLLMLILGISLAGQTVENNIVLKMTKITDLSYSLTWVDNNYLHQENCPHSVYKVYRSEDPRVLGVKIATVNGLSYVDTISLADRDKLYFYQIVRVNEGLNDGAW